VIMMLIGIALNRDLQGGPTYIRCAGCGTVSDRPYRISSRTTYRPGRPVEHTTTPARVDLPLLRPGGAARGRRAAPQ
jgi:hypothetical protein